MNSEVMNENIHRIIVNPKISIIDCVPNFIINVSIVIDTIIPKIIIIVNLVSSFISNNKLKRVFNGLCGFCYGISFIPLAINTKNNIISINIAIIKEYIHKIKFNPKISIRDCVPNFIMVVSIISDPIIPAISIIVNLSSSFINNNS